MASYRGRLHAPIDGVIREADRLGGKIVLVTEQGTELRMGVVGKELPSCIRIGVSEGQRVSRGEILAWISPGRLRLRGRHVEVRLEIRVNEEVVMIPTKNTDVKVGDHLLAII